MGRRYLVQAEQAFRQTIEASPRDEYGYQSLAELYLGWARGSTSDAEAADYVRRAEEVVTEGLKKVPVREGLWVVSADIARWLGDNPTALEALKEAVASTPGGVVGRYLLGKLHLARGEAAEAIQVLQPVLDQSPEEVRTCLTYALAQYAMGARLEECIATLYLCSPHGLRYPKYIATLAGMLFMNGDFTEAEHLFIEGKKRGFAFAEAARVHFVALDEARRTPMRLRGKVVSVRAGYAFVSVDVYPGFFIPGSKYGDVVMERGLELEFSPGFSARGNQATSIATI